MRNGFTLLEVLVSLAFAAVATAAVAHSAWALIRGRGDTERLQVATLIAERSLEEMISRGALALTAEDSSDPVIDPKGDFQRRRVVEPGPRDNLWHLSVSITPAGSGATVSFHTLLRRPWS